MPTFEPKFSKCAGRLWNPCYSSLLILIWNIVSHIIIFIFKTCFILCFKTWRRQWQPTPVLLPGKSHGQRSLVGCSPWGLKESDTTERLHFHSLLSCIGEENGNPLQCSCLRIPGTGEPGGLPSVGSHRVGHDWSDLAAAATVYISIITRKYC